MTIIPRHPQVIPRIRQHQEVHQKHLKQSQILHHFRCFQVQAVHQVSHYIGREIPLRLLLPYLQAEEEQCNDHHLHQILH